MGPDGTTENMKDGNVVEVPRIGVLHNSVVREH